MFAPDFMLGAKSRLLPISIPYRFFGLALLLHVAAWSFLLAGAHALPGFLGGPGPVLAALHLVTLGVLAATAMGAAYQILPVATRKALWSNRLAGFSFWPMALGVPLLAHGLGSGQQWAMEAGGTLTVLALGIFWGLLAENIRQTRDLPAVIWHLWLAVASLAGLAVLGLLLILDWRLGLLGNHLGIAAAHAVLAGYGFMGMFVLGFSHVLVPMFGLSPPAPAGGAKLSAGLAALGLSAGAGGAALGLGWLAAVGAVTGLAAAAAHLRGMQLVMRARMKRSLGTSFIMVRLAWSLLPASLLAGLLLALGVRPDLTGPLFGLLLVFGWLLTFLIGVLQRIMPFLASMNSVRPNGKSILVSTLSWELPLRVICWLHPAALLLLSGGILLSEPLAVQAGAMLGLASALCLLGFGVRLGLTFRHHMKNNTQR